MQYFSNAFICVCRTLNMNQPFEYARGTKSRVSDVDPDTFAIFDMPKYAKDLGITNVAEFFLPNSSYGTS